MTKLDNVKHESFCQEYTIDKNGKQAAIRAGYSPKTAENQASRLLSNDKVRARVDELLSEVSKKALCDAEWVVKHLMIEAQGIGEDTASSARTAALKALAEYTGGFDANKKKIEHSGDGISFNMNFGTDD